jgi:surface polysaccharide O-acyltransferase-like enzyme
MDQRRYYGLDALRGVMMMLGIVLHSAALHMTAPVLEISIDPATSPIFLIVVLFIHNFRMPLFFVLAGFFASLLVKKYELRGALVNRAKRVLGPLLLGMITILPLMGVFAISYGASVRFGDESEIAEQLQILGTKTGLDVPEGNELSPGHLWFLYYLLYFYLAIPVCRAAVNWANQTRYRSRISSGLTSPLLLPALGLMTVLQTTPPFAALLRIVFCFRLFHP